MGTYRTICGVIRSEMAGKALIVAPGDGGVWTLPYAPELRPVVVRAARTAVPQRVTIEDEMIVALADR